MRISFKKKATFLVYDIFKNNLKEEIANLIFSIFTVKFFFLNSWTVSTDRNNFNVYGLAEK